jgi:two-component system sensor histidine kinase CpxA
MKPISSLFTKILAWFFLNLILVITVLAIFFTFQPQVNLHAIFGKQSDHRLRTAGMLITHDLNRAVEANWPDILARHAKIHQVDFALVFEDGRCISSTDRDLPDAVITRARGVLQRPSHPDRFPPPPVFHGAQGPPENHAVDNGGDFLKKRAMGGKPPRHPEGLDKKTRLMMKTRHPTRYWTGIGIPMAPGPLHPPAPALLLAVSNSITGNGFFFDPLPWMIVATAMILISALLWIPMVRNITGPLARITLATEEIAKGRFDVAIHEPRADEIGRLARAVNHMTARLAAFVKGQKRFLGDVAHELGSPIARIQFGLGALEQRVQGENQKRVKDVMEDVDHMSKLVNELLAFSRAEMNTKTVRLESIALLPVIQAAVKREATPDVELVIEIDPVIRVLASAELLTRALANLLRNAVKHTGDTGPIHVYAEKKAGGVALEVRDTGPGVPEDLLDQLFEPFFRPEPSRDRDSGGVGLGLAIVKTCVGTCDGTVSARNLTPKGFAVTIILKT